VNLSSLFILTSTAFQLKHCLSYFTHRISFNVVPSFSPSLFHNFEVARGSSNRSLSNYGLICDAIFITCTYA